VCGCEYYINARTRPISWPITVADLPPIRRPDAAQKRRPESDRATTASEETADIYSRPVAAAHATRPCSGLMPSSHRPNSIPTPSATPLASRFGNPMISNTAALVLYIRRRFRRSRPPVQPLCKLPVVFGEILCR